MTIRSLAISAVFALLAGAAPKAFAQGAGDPFAGHGYQPGIDVLDYDVTLQLPDTGAMIRADVVVTVRRAPTATALRLDLVDRLTVREVRVNGRPVRATRGHDAITVPLASTDGDSLRVAVRYDGTVVDGLIVRRDSLGRWTWFGDNWPDRARQWLASVDHPSDKATVSWTVRAPAGRTVVANGTLLGVRRLTGRDAGLAETRWRE